MARLQPIITLECLGIVHKHAPLLCYKAATYCTLIKHWQTESVEVCLMTSFGDNVSDGVDEARTRDLKKRNAFITSLRGKHEHSRRLRISLL